MIFRFANPVALLLLFILGLWFFIPYLKRIYPLQPLLLFSDVRLMKNISVGWRSRTRHVPDILRLIAWILLVIALARPQSGQSQEILRGQGIDIVLALDISGSMAALDFAPQNRLEAAKEVISRFISGREYDRIGLVVFAYDSFQVTPPTLDYNALIRSFNAVQIAPDIGLQDGTAIGLGLAASANLLRASAATSKVVILLTDGANNAGGVGPVTAAQAMNAFDIRVYTIGMGKPGTVPMPDTSGNIQMVESDVDEPTLQSIASLTNGVFYRAEDLTDLETIYSQINSLERSDVERQIYVRWQEQSGPFLWICLLVIIGERIFRQTIWLGIP